MQIQAPADAPAGKYMVWLDMVQVDNPDEDFVEGPSVTVVVPEPVEEAKPFPWWIVAVVVGVLLIGSLLTWVLTRGNPELTVTAQASPETAVPDSNLTYTYTIRNDGKKAATDVVFTASLPPDGTFVAGASNSICQQVEADIVCSLEDEEIPRDDSVDVIVVVHIGADSTGSLTSGYRVKSEGTEEIVGDPLVVMGAGYRTSGGLTRRQR